MQPYQKLEQEWASFNGKKYGSAVNTGTAGLHIALVALGVGKGDEVIVPAFSMAAAAFAVSYTSAKPVFVDCDDALNIDVSKIENKITSRTKAIIAVHIYGRLCDMEGINKIAQKYGLYVIEDACEVHGAKVGNADATVFSFYRNKIVNAEEGGIVLTDDKQIYENIEYLKNMSLGKVRDYNHQHIGYNYRMPNSQAVLALKSFKQLKKNLAKRKKIESWYDEYLPEFCKLPNRDVVWVYDIMHQDKEQILKTVEGSRPFFVPMNRLPMYKSYGNPVALGKSIMGLYLPVDVSMTKKDIKQICQKIPR